MIVILDTWCIDLLYKENHKDFQETIGIHASNWDIITITMFNYAERISWFREWLHQKTLSENYRDLLEKIYIFFSNIEDNILYPTKNTLEQYADLHYKLKKNWISQGELKSMHNDIWIASIVLENNALFYTNNKNDFEKIKNIEPDFNFIYIKK